ncbi:MAG: cellulase family glycosylhydrolase [Planctomycetota bacterium]
MNGSHLAKGLLCGMVFAGAWIAGCAPGGGGGGGGGDGNGNANGNGAADIIDTTPDDGATGVAPDASIRITFGRAAVPGQVEWTAQPTVAAEETWSSDNIVVTLRPSTALATQTDYSVSIDGVQFADDSELAESYQFSFTTAGQSPPVADKMALWTGETLLRGANIYQRRVYPELDGEEFMGTGAVGPPLTQDDFTRLAEYGANFVNISHPGLYAETPPYILDEVIQDNLDSLLDMAAAADLFAVITFRTGPGRSEFAFFWGQDTGTDPQGGWFAPSYYNNTVWTKQAAQDAWAQMWRYTADRYKDNSIVVGYDLMCEPNATEVFFGIWDEVTEFYPAQAGTLYDWNQFYPDVVAAIREVDTQTPILVEPTGWGAAVWLPYLEPTDDERTVYTIHQYEPSGYTHQPVDSLDITYPGTLEGGETFDQAWLDDLLARTVDDFVGEHGLPVAVNEYGPQRFEPGAGAYMDDLMDLFEQRGMNHVFWEWQPSWPEQQLYNDAFNFLHGADPDNHEDLDTSDHIEAVRKYWNRNTLRPSNVTFTGT